MTIGKADLTNTYQVLVLTVIRQQKDKNGVEVFKEAIGIASAQMVLEENDILVLFGELLNIREVLKS
jgi:trk system potassium uptake protein TrkA